MSLPRTLALLAVLVTASCRAAVPGHRPRGEHAGIERALERLYEAFDFGPGGEADWDAMRALFAPGATFYAPIAPGAEPVGVDAERFVADFQAWSRSSPDVRDGLHERILSTRIERCGNVAHAWVTFTGFVPGSGEVRTRGVDSIQLVRSGAQWQLASFTSHFESEREPLPARFLPARD